MSTYNSVYVQNSPELPYRGMLLFWLFITDSWAVFQYYLLSFSGAWLIHYILGGALFVVLLLSAQQKIMIRICKNPKVILFWIWLLYIVINSYYKNLAESSVRVSFVYMAIFLPLQIYMFYTDLTATLKCTMWALTFTVVSCLIAALENFDLSGRLSAQYVNSNDVAQYVNILLIVVALMLFFKNIRLARFLFYATLCSVVMLLCQSRTSFIGLLYIFFSCIFLFSQKTQKVLGRFLVGWLLLYLFYNYFFVNTRFFNRFASILTEGTVSEYDNWCADLITKYMGERSYYYFRGWEIFENNVWTGIGPENFQWHPENQIEKVCHVEWMSQLCEEGLIGISLFLWALLSLFWGSLKRFLHSRKAVDFAMLLICIFPALECFSTHIFPATRYVIIIAFMIFYLDYFEKNHFEANLCSARKEESI